MDASIYVQQVYVVGESYPIDSTSDEYSGALATITAAVAAHKASIKPVPNHRGGILVFLVALEMTRIQLYSAPA